MRTAQRQRPVLTGLIALALCCVGAPALGQTAAVLGIGGDGSEQLKAEIGEILMNAVEANPDLQAEDQRDLDVTEALMFLGCSEVTTMCLRELAFTLEVDRVLYGAVRETPGETELDLHYFDAIANETLLDQTFPLNQPDERTELEMQLAASVSNRAVLRVEAQRPNVEIFLDGESMGMAPVVAMDLTPGRHTMRAECTDCPDYERVLDVRAGVVYNELARFDTGAVATNEPPPAEEEPGRSGGRNILLPAVTIGTGGAMLLTGAIFGLVMNGTQSDFDQTPSLAEAQDLADTGDTQALLANIFLAGGAAITITGVILLLTMDGEEQPPQPGEVGVAPYAGPSGVGVTLGGAF